jgi:asparagine synthase (glutamine-hydrolysing)
MSGIAGIFNLDGRPVDRELLQAMVAAEAHRGPDEEGLWVQGPVGFGHRQLCTTPESLNERQPVCLYEERYAITCDGRLDNREELISALRGKALVDAATPDADLILHAYIAWGADCLKRIVGDFAFVIWDERKQELFCARDPMGIRTFYYYHDGRRFVFASDINAILLDTSIPRAIDQLAVGLHLVGGRPEPENTLLKGIYQILPAQYRVISFHGVSSETYWEPNPWHQIRYPKMEDYVEHFRELFDEAVRRRLRSNTPVGIALSGGMDSTSIACTAAHLVNSRRAPGTELQSFSSVFEDFPSADESTFISQVLEATGIRGHCMPADQYWGFKPLQNPNIRWNQPYPLPFQARHEALLLLARDSGVRVMFTGEGGDELLNPGFGYLLDLLNSLRLLPLRQELKSLSPESRSAFYSTAARYYKSALWYPVPRVVKNMYQKRQSRRLPPWVVYDLAWGVYRQSQYYGPIKMSRSPSLPYITEMYAYHGVEARHPFLDLRVIEFLIRIPPDLKFSGGWGKILLREAMKGVLPDGVRRRHGKTGFTDVILQGLFQEQERIRSLLDSGYLARAGWINNAEAKAAFENYRSGDLSVANLLMALINLEDWVSQYSQYIDSNGGGASLATLEPTLESAKERR